eukprot:m.140745 g.140745  ORF g.140745 m.140745 type:complete len:74 (+) comp14038_c0_seq4:5828-6049(+)
MTMLFNGATEIPAKGHYVANGTVISERVVVATSFASAKGFAAKVKVVRSVRAWRDVWGQDAMGIEVDGVFSCV